MLPWWRVGRTATFFGGLFKSVAKLAIGAAVTWATGGLGAGFLGGGLYGGGFFSNLFTGLLSNVVSKVAGKLPGPLGQLATAALNVYSAGGSITDFGGVGSFDLASHITETFGEQLPGPLGDVATSVFQTGFSQAGFGDIGNPFAMTEGVIAAGGHSSGLLESLGGLNQVQTFLSSNPMEQTDTSPVNPFMRNVTATAQALGGGVQDLSTPYANLANSGLGIRV